MNGFVERRDWKELREGDERRRNDGSDGEREEREEEG